MTDDLHRLRHHEAGHAIAATAAGYRVTRITVDVVLGHGKTWWRGDGDRPDDAAYSQARLVISSAGLEAERIFSGDWGYSPPCADEDQVHMLARRVARLKGTGRDAALRAGRRAAMLAVESNWAAIGYLAETLRRAGDELEGERLAAAITAAFRGYSIPYPPGTTLVGSAGGTAARGPARPASSVDPTPTGSHVQGDAFGLAFARAVERAGRP